MKEGPWKLPDSWMWKNVKEVAQVIQGKGVSKREYSSQNTGLKMLKFRDITSTGEIDWENHNGGFVNSEASLRSVEPGDVLITSAAHTPEQIGRKVAYLDLMPSSFSQVFFTGEIMAFRPLPSELDGRWLRYWLASVEGFRQVQLQVKEKHLVRSRADNILVPSPLVQEQRRIVAKIEALFNRIREAKRLRAEASNDGETVKEAAVVAAFKEGRSRGWLTKTIGEVIVGKPQYGISQKATEGPDGIPILRMSNIVDGRFSFDDLKYVKLAPQQARKYFLNQGDVLFNRTNSAELVGKSAVFPGGQQAVFASYLIRIVPDSEKALSEFLVAYMNSSFGREYFQAQLTRAIGQVNINAKKLQAMPVPVPSVEEQREVATYLKSIAATAHKLKERHAETDAELQRLEQSILDRAFRGEL